MNKRYVLTIDYGTQSVRAIIYDQFGTECGKEQYKFEPYFSIQPGWAEQEVETYWRNLTLATKALKQQVGEEIWNKVEAMSITTMRDSVILMDKDRSVLRPCILWLDQRECKEAEFDIKPMAKAAFKMAKMYDTAVRQRTKSPCNWIKRNEPEIWKKMDKYILFSCYMNYRLTGVLKDCVANTIGHLPFDYKNKKWADDSLITAGLYDVKKRHMPDLIEPGEVIGYITKEASKDTGIKEGIPLISTGSDKGCETIGTGCVDSKGASISFGTTATIQITLDKYVEPQKYVPSYPAIIKNKYNTEIQIYRGYWLLTWFKNEFAHKEVVEAKKLGCTPEYLLDKHLSEIHPGCDGLILQPYWSPGIALPNARGAVIGFSDYHTRAHLYRAIIEGINFGLYDGLKAIEKKANNRVEYLTVSGGGSHSDEICQITADMFGLPVRKMQTYETGSLGAAMAVFTHLGVFKSFVEASKSMAHITKEYQPNVENTEIYKKLYNKVYKKIYPNNKHLYLNIKKIIGRNVQKENI